MNSKYLCAAAVLATFFAPGMERKRSFQETQTVKKRTKYSDLSTLEKLPRELQIKIITDIIVASGTARDAFNELTRIKTLSTHFHNLLNSTEAVKAIVRALAKRFYHYDAIKAAHYWNTPSSRQWIQSVLPHSAQERIAKALQNKIVTVIAGNFDSIKNELNSAALKDIFNNDSAKIWLITFIIQATSGLRKFTLKELADALYPEATRSVELNEWLKFAESSLLARLPNSLAYSSQKEIEQLADKNIDLTLNLSDHFPALFYAVDPNNIRLVLQAGANINEKDRIHGHTLLHYLILYELQNNVEKNQRVYAAIEMLLKNGANPNIKNSQGKTVLSTVRDKQNKLKLSGSSQDPFFERLIALLQKYGAQ